MFVMTLSIVQILEYSPYFRALYRYGGMVWPVKVQLLSLMTVGEYKWIFRELNKNQSYDNFICNILDHYEGQPVTPLVQFVIYFLEEKFLPDLVCINLGRNVLQAYILTSKALESKVYALFGALTDT